METKLILLFVLIASIELVYTVPLDALLGTGGRRESGHGLVNENGLLSGTNDILGKPLCSLGLTCDECKGVLQGTQPILDDPLNSLGLGVDCDGENDGNGGCGGDNNSGHDNGKGHCKSCGKNNGSTSGGKNNGCKSCGHKNDEHKVPIDGGDCGCDRKALDVEVDGEKQ